MEKSEHLKKLYDELITLAGIKTHSEKDVYRFIRNIISSFMRLNRRVGIYCFGGHTKMLMTDFVAELRDVVCIIDNGEVESQGYIVIKDCEIEKYELDGIIVSSFGYKEQIKDELRKKHTGINVLDIYDELEKVGINLDSEFYSRGPYSVYLKINKLNNCIRNTSCSKEDTIKYLDELLIEYIQVKDFRMAILTCKKIRYHSDSEKYSLIQKKLENIYDFQISIISKSGRNNILLLCFDGLRFKDYDDGKMAKIHEFLDTNSHIFRNAYSFSTMTYESLVPVFSENSNQKTLYFRYDSIPSCDCRFIEKAIEQKRFIAIYGDGNKYIDDKRIKYSGSSQCITEKIWDFTNDICDHNNGLFYLHELYESHYSFPNPYTEGKMIANGMAMLFDYLPRNGGRLQTDYVKQLDDSLKYLDDTLDPFIRNFHGSLVIFADHGNDIRNVNDTINDIKKIDLVASENWIRIPFIVKDEGFSAEVDNELISLMELNDIILTILDKKKYEITKETVPTSFEAHELKN